MSSLEADKGGVNRYTVKCEMHGLHFNPDLTDGCVLCAREARSGAARRGVRGALVALLAAGLLVASFQLSSPDFKGGGDSSNPLRGGLDVFAAGPSRASSRNLGLDPEPYREVISQIESVLYKRSRPTLAELQQTAMAGRDLSDRIQRRENPVVAGQVVLKVLAWSSRSFEVGAGYASPDVARARVGWEQIRDSAFLNAAWFRSGEAAPEAEPEVTRPAVDPAVARALADVGNDIFHLISVGKPESDSIDEVRGVGDPGAAETIRRWERWREDWTRRVQRTAAKMPDPPDPSGDLNLALAYQKMNSALHYLKLVPMTVHQSGVPLSYERENRFKVARSEAEEGEQRLRALER